MIYTAAFLLRLSLGITFLSAVSSRFGLWPQSMGGGTWTSFLEYTAELNPWAPASFVPLLGAAATTAELTLGVLLIIGLRQRITGVASCVLLLIFALSMINGTGIKSPLDYSVFTASASSLILAAVGDSAWSLDSIVSRKTETIDESNNQRRGSEGEKQ